MSGITAAPTRAETPLPEADFSPVRVAPEPCEDRTYPECRRLRFTYGPLVVGPGNNAQLVGPVTVEKPAEDGYMLRFRPDLVRADGTPPPVNEIHLHHAVWLNVLEGGYAPFAAAGEEKTIVQTRAGAGYLIEATDTWQLGYMLHNATPRTETLWVVYDVDFVPRAAAERRGIQRVAPLWLDVLRDVNPTYSVFNVHKGSGRINPFTGKRECTYPRERCAPFDPFGNDQPGNGKGWDYVIEPQEAGTLIWAGGHVHPGGLRVEMSVVRGAGDAERERRIFTSEAIYWDPNGPVSWDLSMTRTEPDWAVEVRPGDRLRINAVYDSQRASWYEGMGIMVAFVVPGDKSGVDPFSMVRVRERIPVKRKTAAQRRAAAKRRAAARRRAALRRRITARRRAAGGGPEGQRAGRPRRLTRAQRRAIAKRRVAARRRAASRRRVRYRWVWRPVPIETRGQVTHGHLPEASNYGGQAVRPLRAPNGGVTTEVNIANFRYSAGDLSTVERDGIPLVPYNGRVNFNSLDAAAGIWHTITTCRPPCTGTVGISYPLADDDSRLDSLELGYSPNTKYASQPPANRSNYTISPREAGLQPGSVATYYCRIHPFMRGAFKVVR